MTGLIGLSSGILLLAGLAALAQQPPAAGATTPAVAAAPRASGSSAASALYLQLNSVGLDPAAVYHIRDALIEREDLHISLDDGTIAFTQAVDGHVTGAFFEGEGEVLLLPPDQAERISLTLFTGAAVLEEKFTNAYFRFNDNTAADLKPWLRPTEDAQEFIAQWDTTARNLAEGDALRLLTSFLNAGPATASGTPMPPPNDRLLRVRFQGGHLGVFDLFFDTQSSEQIAMGKFSYEPSGAYYDVLASFPMRSARSGALADPPGESARVLRYKIRARVAPPSLEADTQLDLNVIHGGDRVLLFELSRYLKLSRVEADGQPVEFLQNEALEGTALSRRGNDVVALIFPQPLAPGLLHMRFTYAGSVLADAGGGLFYVGARGIWYPNRGMVTSDYDIEFHYPTDLTLVATGKQVSHQVTGDEQVAHWVSDRPIPLAGFNLGRYRQESAKAGNVEVDAYATPGVETTFPKPKPEMVAPPRANRRAGEPPALTMPPPGPAPSRNALDVAETSARALDFYSRHFGPYPYSSLALAQMPGRSSQGWPSLVFLSSFAFLSPLERQDLHLRPFDALLYSPFMQLHETAHQWWGDLVVWKTYRDQWLLEALANYSAILAMEKEHPDRCKEILEHYRQELVSKNDRDEEEADAGPVTLGLRLSSSHFPDGFDAISYGRGTWLIHMLRTMLRDAAPARTGEEEPFFRVLRKLRERYQGKSVSTREFLDLVSEELPASLQFEGGKSLDWFYRGWVNGTALPRLQFDDVKFSRRGSSNVVTGTILQKDAPQDLVTSVPVYASVGAKSLVLLGRVFADGEQTGFRFEAPAGARKLVLDPYQTLLTRP